MDLYWLIKVYILLWRLNRFVSGFTSEWRICATIHHCPIATPNQVFTSDGFVLQSSFVWHAIACLSNPVFPVPSCVCTAVNPLSWHVDRRPCCNFNLLRQKRILVHANIIARNWQHTCTHGVEAKNNPFLSIVVHWNSGVLKIIILNLIIL